MPLPAQVLRELERIVGAAGLVVSREGLLTYECDMHTFYNGAPDAVVLPESAQQVAEIVRPNLRLAMRPKASMRRQILDFVAAHRD